MYWVILLLLILLFFHWKKEGYENYDASCISLAKKNQANLDSLKKRSR